MSDPDLSGILEELRPMEPLFHTDAFGTTLAEFARRMTDDYFEVGASGRRYDRDFILQHLQANPPVSAAEHNWQTSDHALRRLSPHTYLLTYTLQQDARRTRRSTIWQRTAEGWRIVYHQGTLVEISDGSK